MFSIVSSAFFILVAAFLIYFSYTKQREVDKESPDKKQVLNFSSWLIKGFRSFFKTSLKDRIKKIDRKYLISERSITEKIIWGGLVLSFLYLFLSGFFFSLFSLRRMFGIPLLFHIVLGGLFAVLLCVCLFLSAKKFSFPSFSFENILFWIFMLSGLFLAGTSLCMMLPLFTYRTQLFLFELHRYSALAATLSSVFFLYTAFSKNEKRKNRG
jgi:hypothetical protein